VPFLSPDDVRSIGALSTVGLSFVLAIVLGALAGWWLDRWFGTSPLFFFIGFAFGLAAGVLNVVRVARQTIK
jgi:F0F1-type ATP synthase assembly protein I